MNFLTILFAVIVFLAIIWLLVAILLFARKKLVPDKKVKVRVNKEKVYEADCGCTLLQSLSDEEIYLPSACGGQGTCGTCKGIILSGGGEILPTERVHIDRKMAEQNVRLFCQVKVKDDMDIEIAPEILGVKKWECEVISNKSVATYINELVVKLPDNEKLNFKSGSYIQIHVPKTQINFQDISVKEKYAAEWRKYNIFQLVMKNREITTRAYSIANSPED
ncbi:MAG TPA: 2Fe-2S iron-sulfur cluster-binding protein, partial [Bacteroidales bacterium]|nr:2Fe-2S iron-sulfur cluster-binding protein [Bacteroidales bacterium]